MTVHIYNTPTAPEHLYKDVSDDVRLTPEAGIGGAVRGAVVVDNPVVTVEGTWKSGNYCYIPDFGRYYYIIERDLERKDLTVLYLQSDPLMSFASQILDQTILVNRCTKKAEPGDPAGYNSYLHDGQIRISSQSYYREFAVPGISFEYPTNYNNVTPQYILGVIG